jgi:phospholipid-binding lipoprotein MlaA
MRESGIVVIVYFVMCLFSGDCFAIKQGNMKAANSDQQQGSTQRQIKRQPQQQNNKDDEDSPDDEDEFMFGEKSSIYDPLEPFNRAVFSFNSAFDRAMFAPLARAYSKAVPPCIQDAAKNVVSTFFTPIRLVNFALQGEGKQVAKTVFRFAYNILFGFFGVFDVAKKIGITTPNTGFSDTFKKWGMKPGPYFVLPVLGPSSMRGSFGKILDFPLTSLSDDFVPSKTQAMKTRVRYLMTGEDLLVARVDTLDILDDIEKMSVDKYVATRSAVMAMEK